MGAASESPASDAGLVDRYLEHVRVEKRLAARTVELYSLDLQKLGDYAARIPVALLQVQNHHIRLEFFRQFHRQTSVGGRLNLKTFVL